MCSRGHIHRYQGVLFDRSRYLGTHLLAQGLGWHAFFFRIACICTCSTEECNIMSGTPRVYVPNTGFGTC